MHLLLAIVLLGVTAAAHVAALLLGRHAVRRIFAPASAGEERTRSAGYCIARGTAGVAGWYLASSVLVAIAMLGRGEVVADEASMRVHVNSIGPAGRAGVQDGDRIVKVAGEPITSWEQLKSVVSTSSADAIPIEVERGGSSLTFDVTPEGAPRRIMVGPWSETRSVGVGRAMASGLAQPGKVVANTFKGLWRMLAGREHAEFTGPAGIVKETSNANKEGFTTGLLLAALLASYVLPFVALASALFEILARRRD